MPTLNQESDLVAVYNGIPVRKDINLPLPDSLDAITANALLVMGQAPHPRLKIINQCLVRNWHAFVRESRITAEEWANLLQLFTKAGQRTTEMRCEFELILDVLGMSSLVDALNNPPEDGATESSLLGPFHNDRAVDVEYGGSIASEEQGELLYVEGHVLSTDGKLIANAVIDTWQADHTGHYDDIQLRGRLHTREDGSFAYRTMVPASHPIPGDGPLGELLAAQGRHNMRPGHLHLIVEAPRHRRLVTALYPEGSEYLTTDVTFGVKKSLVVKLEQVDDAAQAEKRGIQGGGPFKLLRHDIVLLTEEQSRQALERAVGRLSFQDN